MKSTVFPRRRSDSSQLCISPQLSASFSTPPRTSEARLSTITTSMPSRCGSRSACPRGVDKLGMLSSCRSAARILRGATGTSRLSAPRARAAKRPCNVSVGSSPSISSTARGVRISHPRKMTPPEVRASASSSATQDFLFLSTRRSLRGPGTATTGGRTALGAAP